MNSRKEAARSIIEDIARVSRELGRVPSERVYLESGLGKFSKVQIKSAFSNWTTALKAAGLTADIQFKETVEEKREPKVLIFDIETCPMLASIWSPRQDYIPHNQIKAHRAIIAFAALWLGDPPEKMIYLDQRKSKDFRDDRALVKKLWDLLNEADVVVTKNGKRFDQKVAFSRMAINGLTRPSDFMHEDIEQLFRKHFDLPYYNLDFLSQTFCKKYKKSGHEKFPGMKLWDECMSGNIEAWKEMEHYNKHDVLATEELRRVIIPWGTNVDLNVFHSDTVRRCVCGGTNVIKSGYRYSATGKFQRYKCQDCGHWSSAKGEANNLLSKKKKLSLKD